MTFGSVCSGIEAASVAWEPLGFRCAFVAEIDPFPCAVLAHRYPEVPNLGDFTTIGADAGPVDVLVGGTPCQSFSVAGLRGGMADARGNLALEFLRLAGRLRPEWVVWENVPGVLSSVDHDAPDARPPDINLDGDDGPRDGEEVVVEDEYDADEDHAFACFLSGLQELGYGFASRVLDAQYLGVPQRRRRVFVVGHSRDWRRAASVLFERHCLSGNPPPRREAESGIAPSVTPGARRASGQRSGEQLTVGSVTTRAWADRDCEHSRLALCLNGSNQRLDGPVETLITHSLRADGFDASEDGTGRGTPLVPVHPYTLAIRGREDGSRFEFRQDGLVNAILTPNGGRAGIGVGAVAFAQNTRDELREMPYVGALAAEPGMKQTSYIRQAMKVRRITPRECERLQGFPDDWTMVPYRGKPAKDGNRYKAIGNSMAVPVMAWIGRRILSVMEANP